MVENEVRVAEVLGNCRDQAARFLFEYPRFVYPTISVAALYEIATEESCQRFMEESPEDYLHELAGYFPEIAEDIEIELELHRRAIEAGELAEDIEISISPAMEIMIPWAKDSLILLLNGIRFGSVKPTLTNNGFKLEMTRH